MTESTDTNLGVQSVFGSFGVAVQQLAGLAVMVAFAHIGGAAGVGGFFFLLAVMNIADAPVQSWNNAAHRFRSERDTDPGEILGSQLTITGAVSLTLAAVAFAARAPLAEHSGVTDAWLFLSVLFATGMTYRVAMVQPVADGRVSLKEWLTAGRTLFKSGIQLAALSLGWYIGGMVLGYAAASLAAGVLTLALFGPRPSAPSLDTLRRLYGFAKFAIVSTFVKQTFSRVNTVLLAFLLVPAVVGQYEVAFRLTMPSVIVSSVVATALLSRVSNLSGKGVDPSEDVTLAVSFASLLAAPILAGSIILAAPLITTVFGPEFAPAAPFLIGLAAWRLIASQSACLSSTLAGLNRPRMVAIGSAAALGTNLALGLAFVTLFGGLGIVASTVIAETARYAIYARAVRDELPNVTLFPGPLRAQLAAGGLMMAIIGGMTAGLTPSPTLMTAAVILGAVVYGLMTLALSPMTRGMAVDSLPRTLTV